VSSILENRIGAPPMPCPHAEILLADWLVQNSSTGLTVSGLHSFSPSFLVKNCWVLSGCPISRHFPLANCLSSTSAQKNAKTYDVIMSG